MTKESADPLRTLRDTTAFEARMTALRAKTNAPLLRLLAHVANATILDLIDVQETFESYKEGRYFDAPDAVPIDALSSMLQEGMKERRLKLPQENFGPTDFRRQSLLRNNLELFIQSTGSNSLEDCAAVLDALLAKNPSGIAMSQEDIVAAWAERRKERPQTS